MGLRSTKSDLGYWREMDAENELRDDVIGTMWIGGHARTHDWTHSPTAHFEAHTRKVNMITTHSSTVNQLLCCSTKIAGADLD